MKFVKFITEALFWLNIFIVPVLVSLISGYALYYFAATQWALACSVILVIAGVVSGILWAERVRKTVGCSVYVNRIFSSPDLDNK